MDYDENVVAMLLHGANPIDDFSPTQEQVSLHGLGFMQVILPASKRLHVWHPDIPRRKCHAVSSIHNHRFAFKSTVLIGTMVNRRYEIVRSPEAYATHDMVSHDGERLATGARRSFVDGHCKVTPYPDEVYEPGQSYYMDALAYHETVASGVVVTLMEKLHEGTVHAHSIIAKGHVFDQSFDRYQWTRERLWSLLVGALSERSV